MRALLAITVLVLVGLAAGWTAVRPSHDRAWIAEHAVLPHARFAGDQASIHGVRNFAWIDSTAVPAWEDRSYDLARIESVWFIVSPFSSEWRGPAHTFLSFGFADSQYVAISVEARKEMGETYSLWKGAAKQFEILYVIGDERDLIRLRTDVWGDDVYVYPIRASREHVRALFVQMLERANRLREHPEFYNTLTNNCTTNLIEHVNRIAPGTVPYGWRTLLPGYTDEVAEALGLLATDEPLAAARERFRVNGRARAHAGDPLFSLRIREAATPRGTAP